MVSLVIALALIQPVARTANQPESSAERQRLMLYELGQMRKEHAESSKAIVTGQVEAVRALSELNGQIRSLNQNVVSLTAATRGAADSAASREEWYQGLLEKAFFFLASIASAAHVVRQTKWGNQVLGDRRRASDRSGESR